MFEQYQSSGKVGPVGIPAMLIAAGGAALVLGVVYVYLIVWIPIVYVNFLATIGFGVGLGLAIDRAARFGQVRNSPAAHFFGLIAGLAGLYVAWAWDGAARTSGEEESFPVLWNPVQLMAYMQFFYETGFWGIKGGNVSGIPLAVIWVIEGLVIVGTSSVLAGITASTPFCESCGAWTTETEGLKRLLPPDDPDALSRLSDGDLSVLDQFMACDTAPDQSIRLDLHACSECEDTRFLTVNLSRVTFDDDGDATEHTTAIIERLVLDAGSMHELQTTLDALEVAEVTASVPEESTAGENGDDRDEETEEPAE